MRAFVLFLLALPGLMAAQVIDKFDYKDAAAAASAWAPLGESTAPAPSMGGDMVKGLRFPCTFENLKDWRVYWDREVKLDLSGSEQILIKLKCPDPNAVGQAMLYFKSGAGWYRMPGFSVGSAWETKVLARNQAVAEDSPTGWQSIDRVRIAFLPSQKKATFVDLALLEAREGWPLSYLGSVGGYKNLDSAEAGILKAAKGSPLFKEVAARLKEARAISVKAAANRDKAERQELILQGREKVAQAWTLTRKPKDNEFRAFWVHHGDGPRGTGGDRVARWKDVIPAIRAQGFNTIAPNVAWSGVAFYPSKVVPQAPGVAKEGDYLQEVIDAAKPVGMKVHAWKVMWQFAEGWLAPLGVSEPFRKAGRLQVDDKGKEQPWLCPCDDRNRKYEMDALKELARNYDIDGIHLDYIRWSGPEVSFSKMCRERFEEATQSEVKNWPADCAPGGPRAAEYGDFKREVITSFVREARQELKKIKPGLEFSAAVFAYVGIARDQVYQDWPLWARENLFDWISTMTYTEDAAGFKSAVEAQKAAMGDSRTRLYPGMQVSFDAGRVAAIDSLAEQIEAVRDLGLGGFTLFEYRDQLQDTDLPYLRAGLLREGEAKLSFRPLPDWARSAEPQAGVKLQAAGNSLLVDDFEDGNLVNALRSPWTAETDNNQLGTTLAPKPLIPFQGGAGKSKFALGMTGHYGKNQAPWPYAMLRTGFTPGSDPADLSAFKTLVFEAKGNGKNYEVALIQDVVKDYGYARQAFKADANWSTVRLRLRDFAQPGWAAPVTKKFVDLKAVQFQPSGMNDEDYEVLIDNVRLEK